MSDGLEHPQSGPGTDGCRWVATKLFVAAHVTATFL